MYRLLAAALRGPQLTGLIIRRSATACMPPHHSSEQDMSRQSSDPVVSCSRSNVFLISSPAELVRLAGALLEFNMSRLATSGCAAVSAAAS